MSALLFVIGLTLGVASLFALLLALDNRETLSSIQPRELLSRNVPYSVVLLAFGSCGYAAGVVLMGISHV